MRSLSAVLLFVAACADIPAGQAGIGGVPAAPAVGPTNGPDNVALDGAVAETLAATSLDQARYYVHRDSYGHVDTVWLMLSNLRGNPCSVRCEDTAAEPDGTIAKLNIRLSGEPSLGLLELSPAEVAGSTFILTQPGCDDELGGPLEAAALGHRSMKAQAGQLKLRRVDLDHVLSGSLDLLLPIGSLSGEFSASHCSELDVIQPPATPADVPHS
ncbi:MAG: hypothetical protein OXR73_17410 [Myxococcales bacterium]|nr:hypothetical protein [Myxococcales bacterium]